MSQYIRGDAHPLYKTGHPYGPSWLPARRIVLARDLSCRDCGAPPREDRSLDVHHIVPFREFGIERESEANDPANLMALCEQCHIKREWATNWHDRIPFGRVLKSQTA